MGIVSKFEETAEVVEHGGQRHRFKQTSEKEWLTAFGVARLTRGYYQPDAGGKGVVPLDVRCGMVDRFATPDVEELMALASSNLVPKEVETLLGKALPHGPSATAVQRVLRLIGDHAIARVGGLHRLQGQQDAPLRVHVQAAVRSAPLY